MFVAAAHHAIAEAEAVIAGQAIEQGHIPADQIDGGLDDRQLGAGRGRHGMGVSRAEPGVNRPEERNAQNNRAPDGATPKPNSQQPGLSQQPKG